MIATLYVRWGNGKEEFYDADQEWLDLMMNVLRAGAPLGMHSGFYIEWHAQEQSQ